MWNASTGKHFAAIEGHPYPSTCVRFNPAYMMMVTACHQVVSVFNLVFRHGSRFSQPPPSTFKAFWIPENPAN